MFVPDNNQRCFLPATTTILCARNCMCISRRVLGGRWTAFHGLLLDGWTVPMSWLMHCIRMLLY